MPATSSQCRPIFSMMASRCMGSRKRRAIALSIAGEKGSGSFFRFEFGDQQCDGLPPLFF